MEERASMALEIKYLTKINDSMDAKLQSMCVLLKEKDKEITDLRSELSSPRIIGRKSWISSYNG